MGQRLGGNSGISVNKRHLLSSYRCEHSSAPLVVKGGLGDLTLAQQTCYQWTEWCRSVLCIYAQAHVLICSVSFTLSCRVNS